MKFRSKAATCGFALVLTGATLGIGSGQVKAGESGTNPPFPQTSTSSTSGAAQDFLVDLGTGLYSLTLIY
jgi:hypothetical protein